MGSVARAEKLATQWLHDVKSYSSTRGFKVFTGMFNSVQVSIVATGMGIANMDFVVRETRNVVKGPMAIVRFGTCGGLQRAYGTGCVVVADPGSIMVRRNPDAFRADATAGQQAPYLMSQMVHSDRVLTDNVSLRKV